MVRSCIRDKSRGFDECPVGGRVTFGRTAFVRWLQAPSSWGTGRSGGKLESIGKLAISRVILARWGIRTHGPSCKVILMSFNSAFY